MTPPSAATDRATRPHSRRAAPQRPPRRVSGPARGRAHAPRPGADGAAVAAPPLAVRVARAGARVGDARLLDRLVRGRAWIAIVAIGLLGIVFVQVSMLRLNAGISRAVTSAETLHRQNSALRGEISKLDSGARIADGAGALGMALPPAGDVGYLDARRVDAAAAARAMRPPDPEKRAASGLGKPPAAGAATATQSPVAATQSPVAATQGAVAPTQGSVAPTQTSVSQTQTPVAAPTGTPATATGATATATGATVPATGATATATGATTTGATTTATGATATTTGATAQAAGPTGPTGANGQGGAATTQTAAPAGGTTTQAAAPAAPPGTTTQAAGTGAG